MKNKKGIKNCTTGVICGGTCISRLRTCRVSKTPEIKARVIEAVLAVKTAEAAAATKEKRAIAAIKHRRAAVKPTAVKPADVKPTAVKPAAVKPAAVKPAAVKPAAVKPTAVKPTAVKPAAVKPPAVKPAAVKPAAVKPTAVKPAENKLSAVPVFKPSKPEAVGQQLGRGAFGSVTLNADGTVTKTYTRQVPEQSQKNEAYFQTKAAEIGLAPKVISTGSNRIVMERANGVVAAYFDKKTQAMIAEKTIDALKELHKIGIAHNDVHPGNVFYDPATKKVQLIDFGNSSNLSMDITFEKAFDNVREIF